MKAKALIPLIISALVCFSQNTMGQNIKSKIFNNRADKKFQTESYVDALKLYKKALKAGDTTMNTLAPLAESSYKLNNYNQAKKWYDLLFETGEPDSAFYYLQYAEVLRANDKYEKAKTWLNKYRQKKPEAKISQTFSSREFVNELKSDSGLYEISRLKINTKKSDFGPAFFKDSIVFSSAKETDNKLLSRKYNWNEEPFLNLYASAWIDEDNLSSPSIFAEELVTKYHEGPVDFVRNDTLLYFTRNNYLKLGNEEKRINRLKIYRRKWNGVKWTRQKELSFNSDSFSCGHPSLTNDGKTMYFASDMAGGYGETDIYITRLKKDGWSEPENLGSKINTAGKEMFPFIHPDGTLYYSSNGKSGLGGLDVYAAYHSSGGFKKPVNMGYPLNSSRDDFSFILNKNNRDGFFASNRTPATSDDIYYVKIFPKPPKAIIDTLTIKKYKRNVPIHPLENDITTDCDTFYMRSLADKSTQGVNIEKRKNAYFTYTPPAGFVGKDTIAYSIRDTFSYYKGIDKNKVVIDVTDAYYGVEGKVVYKKSGDPVPDVNVTLFGGDRTKKINQRKTNEKGEFEFELQPHKDYALFYKKDSLINLTEYISTKDMDPGVLKVKQVVEMEELEVGKKFAVNIYFDLAKWDIRPDAANLLDEKVYRFLQDNPSVTIELSAHTDCRGSDAYNKQLSQKRAESAVQYLIDEGIDPERMNAEGYGEERLTNRCDDGVDCSDEKHQENRRVEIEILSYK